MPVHFDYQQMSDAERLRSIMPGCPVGDYYFNDKDYQQKIIEWEQEEQLARQLQEEQAAKAIGKLLRDHYSVRHHSPDEFAAEYIMYVEPVRN